MSLKDQNADLSQYCEDHTCELCIKLYSFMSGINMVIEGSKCCKKHTCAEKNCFKEVLHQHVIEFGRRAYHSDRVYPHCKEHITESELRWYY